MAKQLKSGINPRDLALACAFGATLGIMPLIWGTSLLCIVLAGFLRLNQVVVQCANYLMYPLQIVLFVPYLILGEQLFDSRLLPEDQAQLLAQIRQTPELFFSHFWQSNLQALLVWLVLSPPVFIIAYQLSRLLAKRVQGRFFSVIPSQVA